MLFTAKPGSAECLHSSLWEEAEGTLLGLLLFSLEVVFGINNPSAEEKANVCR